MGAGRYPNSLSEPVALIPVFMEAAFDGKAVRELVCDAFERGTET